MPEPREIIGEALAAYYHGLGLADLPEPYAAADAVLAALAAVGHHVVFEDEPRHLIELRADGWTIKHPLACRPDLFACKVNRASEQDPPPPEVDDGVYRCDANDAGDLLLIGDRIDGGGR